MTLPEFASRLVTICPPLDGTQTALAVLWWDQRYSRGDGLTPGELARKIQELGLGAPHSTRLADRLVRTKLTLKTRGAIRLKADAVVKVEALIGAVLEPRAPDVPAEREFLPDAVWRGTRGYIQSVCVQMNGCYFATYYDAASVMLRRLIETLLIEAYEKLGRQAEIQGPDGNYLMLRDLIDRAANQSGLLLGRDSKKALHGIKELGDRAAHNRRFMTRQRDLDELRSGTRVLADDLIAIAALRSSDRPISRER